MPDLNANSAMSANNPMTLDEYAAANGIKEYSYGFGGNFVNYFDGIRTKLERDYENYLTGNNRDFELQKINDARAWEEYMDSTKYQRMAKDLEAIGLNPALVLASGIGASGQPSSPTGTYSSGSAAERTNQKKESKAGQYATQLASTAIRAIAMIAAFA